MAERGIIEANWSYHSFVLTNAKVAQKGHLACLDLSTGEVVPGEEQTDLLAIGWFTENKTGDGTLKVRVRLTDEVKAFWLANDSAPNDVAASDRGNTCYIKDSETVSMDSNSSARSIAGRVLDVDSTKGVLVQFGAAVTGPAGAVGASILGGGVADRTALKAIPAASRYSGRLMLVRSDNSLWVFAGTSTATDATENLVCTPAVGSGRWLRADKSFVMDIPIAFGTADAAAIFTTPAGFVLKIVAHPYWDVTTAWTGGSSSSIGLSSSKTGYTTKGDLIAATVEAALTAGVRKGTIGDKMDSVTEMQALHLEATDTLRHDRIVSAFTAGAGSVRVPVLICTMPAAA
jgi:hypothetical protein